MIFPRPLRTLQPHEDAGGLLRLLLLIDVALGAGVLFVLLVMVVACWRPELEYCSRSKVAEQDREKVLLLLIMI